MPRSLASARYRIVLAALLPAAWSCWVSSRSLVPTQHHHLRQIGGLLGRHAVKACRHDLTPSSQCQCFAAGQHERYGAGCGSRLAGASCWHPSSTAVGHPQLRQNYITPHCIKCRSSHSQAPFVALHRFAPCGSTQQALCKIAYAEAVSSRLHSPVASRPTCSCLTPYWRDGTCSPVRLFAHSM